MTETNNLHLPQWEETDRIHHDDFNDAMAKIDTAVTEKARIVTGTYTGDGEPSLDIDLGRRPKAVFVCTEEGTVCSTASPFYYYGGLALDGIPSVRIMQGVSYPIVEITDSGFRVFNTTLTNGSRYIISNSTNTYHYIAVL